MSAQPFPQDARPVAAPAPDTGAAERAETPPRLISWVEEFVGTDVRVLGVLADKPRRGRPALVYRVERNGMQDHECFASFDAALTRARQLALPAPPRDAARAAP